MASKLNCNKDSHQLTAMILRGRLFSPLDLQAIQECVSEYYENGRTYISKRVCEQLDWRQPNGWLKDRACRDVLRTLDDIGLINLPPSRVKSQKNNTEQTLSTNSSVINHSTFTPVTEFPSNITLEFAKGNQAEREWNELVDRFHYLGHKVAVGRNIKYIIKSENTVLGAVGFSSPAWRLGSRDKLLEDLGIDQPRDYVINNSRFLILPHVQVYNLASYVLALAAKKIVEDWTWYYSLTPLIAETFVQPSLFHGTCYKAANWLEIGTTRGYAKRGSTYRNSQEQKKIFIYGLDRRIRSKLQKLVLGG